MDINSVLGPIIGVSMIIIGLILEGGHVSSILQHTAFLIVIGGMAGAVMLAYPLKDMLNAFKALGTIFMNPKPELSELYSEILDLAQVARKDSILALEKMRANVSYPPLASAVRLAVDGTDPGVIKSTLETAQSITMEEQEIYVHFWEDCGAIAPTMGILGAVLGLIHVMENLDKPELIGPGIAIAFVATLYGVGFANLFFIPFGKKIKRKAKLDYLRREMVIIGIEGILAGLNPKVIEEQLMIFTDNQPEG